MNEKSFLALGKTFLHFSIYSGLGWLCDFVTYLVLVEVADARAFVANFISSYIGVTFVYMTSLRYVFNTNSDHHIRYLTVYWLYQFVSILAYSAVLTSLVFWLETQGAFTAVHQYSATTGKVIITPVNLLSNFVFMKLVSWHMRRVS